MSHIQSPHDKVFKAAMKDVAVARAFLQNALPMDLSSKANWQTLNLYPGSFISKAARAFHTDILYSVELNHQQCFIYCLIEQQSTAEELMPLRLWEYMTKIWRYYLEQQYGKEKPAVGSRLPLIYPLIYYTGKRSPYPYSTHFLDCFADKSLAEKYLFQPFSLIDLTQVSDEQLKQYQLAAGLMLLQKHIYDTNITFAFETLVEKGIWSKIMQHDGEYWEILLEYAVRQGKITQNPEQFFEHLIEITPEKRNDIMTIAELVEKKNSRKIAVNFLVAGSSAKFVADNTGLTLAEVQALEASLINSHPKKQT